MEIGIGNALAGAAPMGRRQQLPNFRRARLGLLEILSDWPHFKTRVSTIRRPPNGKSEIALIKIGTAYWLLNSHIKVTWRIAVT